MFSADEGIGEGRDNGPSPPLCMVFEGVVDGEARPEYTLLTQNEVNELARAFPFNSINVKTNKRAPLHCEVHFDWPKEGQHQQPAGARLYERLVPYILYHTEPQHMALFRYTLTSLVENLGGDVVAQLEETEEAPVTVWGSIARAAGGLCCVPRRSHPSYVLDGERTIAVDGEMYGCFPRKSVPVHPADFFATIHGREL